MLIPCRLPDILGAFRRCWAGEVGCDGSDATLHPDDAVFCYPVL
jgi:hypothetical protein